MGLLKKDTVLRAVDVLLLQEVDDLSSRMIADSLGMSYVYYPATRHPFTSRDFGNAVLSRWPIEDDAKIVLPYLAKFGGSQRIAVAATIRFAGRPVRVYSLHMPTPITNGLGQRREQLRLVLEDARQYRYAAIGGDFNSESLPALALELGLRWPTRHLPATAAFWTVDHVLLRDMDLCGAATLGVRNDPFDTSDHLPIWIDVKLDSAAVPGRP